MRDKKITAIIPASEYEYSGFPVINGRGFEVVADNNKAVQDFLKEYNSLADSNDPQFFAKWIKFNTYRKIIIKA